MKNIFKKIVSPITAVFRATINIIISLKDVRQIKRIAKKQNIELEWLNESRLIDQREGKLDKRKEFTFYNKGERIFFHQGLWYDKKLNPKLYISPNNHKTLEFEYPEWLKKWEAEDKNNKIKLVIKVPEEETNIKVTTGKNPPFYKTIDLSSKKVELLLDPQIYDKENFKKEVRAYDFTIDAFRILNTKTLEFLEEMTPREKLIFSAFGFFMGVIATAGFVWGTLIWKDMI